MSIYRKVKSKGVSCIGCCFNPRKGNDVGTCTKLRKRNRSIALSCSVGGQHYIFKAMRIIK